MKMIERRKVKVHVWHCSTNAVTLADLTRPDDRDTAVLAVQGLKADGPRSHLGDAVRTVLGRYAFALGSNEEATRLSGVNVARWKIAIYTLAGVFSGLAGVLIAARLNSAQPALGQGYELDAIAAAVIGGTSLSGGEGSILGTVIGAFIISTLTNGLRIMSVPQEWQTVVTGAIVILAVYLDIVRRGQSAAH